MGKKVLIIDDEKLIIRMTAYVLESSGYQVISAMDGESGYRTAVEEQPDIVLLDINMPGLDGWGTLELIKKDEKTRDIPVIIFTAKEMPKARKIAVEKGASDYITKPFEIDDLLEKVNNLLK